MLCEDHAVMDVAEQFGFDGCHSLTASPGRRLGTLQGQGVSYQLPLQSLCLEPKQGPTHWMLCLGWVLEEIFFFSQNLLHSPGSTAALSVWSYNETCRTTFPPLGDEEPFVPWKHIATASWSLKGKRSEGVILCGKGELSKTTFLVGIWAWSSLQNFSKVEKIWSGCSYRKMGGGFQGWGWSSAIKFAMQLWRLEFGFLEPM